MPEEHVITNELSAMKERLGYASIVQYCLEEMADTFRVYAYLNEQGEIEGQYSREFSIARSLEGIVRGTSVHAAGQIIWQAATPLNEVVPFIKQKDNDHVLAFEGGVIESVGCVKFDLLGVFEADIIKTFENYVRTGQYKVFV
jgi:DNA polymerase III alpha subunit